jgi:para-aminobenzoate synthetase/4-amino-4-deoxychorismate lyase
MSTTPTVLLESFRSGEFDRSFRFDGLERVIVASTTAEVVPVFREVEQAVAAGRHAAGFVSYEAATAFNPDLPAGTVGNLPLVWFGIFRERIKVDTETAAGDGSDCRLTNFAPTFSEEAYRQAIAAIREYIAAGHTYQVNYTFRQRFGFHGAHFGLYRRICRSQRAAFSA